MPFLANFIPRAGVRYGDDSGVDEDDVIHIGRIDFVIHIGRIDFRNNDRVFGIKNEDRRAEFRSFAWTKCIYQDAFIAR
jgi:hypothetical protein